MATACKHRCSCQRGPNTERGKWYGVRSYLHLFYKDYCTGSHTEGDLEDSWSPPARTSWAFGLWKVALSAGTLLLITGGVALATGYLLPSKLEGIGEAEFVVLDQQAVEYNHALDICRAAGMVLCVLAGALLVTCLLLTPGLGRTNQSAKQREGQLPLVQETPLQQWGSITSAAPTPFQVSWVQSIQPK